MVTQRIDGKQSAAHILSALREDVLLLPRAPRLKVFMVGTHPASESYVRIKERRAKDVGIEYVFEHFHEEVSTEILCASIRAAPEDACVVQLPLPAHVSTDAVLSVLSVEKDADVLSPEAYTRFEQSIDGALLPPVVFAIREALTQAKVNLEGKSALVIGNGRLVGKPAATWLRARGARVRVVTRASGSLSSELAGADIIVSGAGTPALVTPELISQGVVLIDAGTSESEGVLVGDIDPACQEKASVFTPVPGGIGPLTVAGLLSNTVALAKRRFA